MAVANPYLTGKPTYGGTSTTSPTQGTVDPTGYIERELSKTSTSRSGLAATAMQRISKQMTDKYAPTYLTKPKATATAAPKPLTTGVVRTPTGRIESTPIQSTTAGSTSANVLRDALAKLQAGDTGGMDISGIIKMLGAPGPAMSNNTNIGSDAQANDERAQLLSQRNKALMQFMTQGQDLEENFTNANRGIEQQIPAALRDVLEGFSGRGLAFSSGYADEVGQANNQFANMRADLNSQRTRGLRDLIMGRIGFDEDYTNGLSAIQTAAARRLAEKAGDLNLNPEGPGNITPPPLPVITPGNGISPGQPGNETEQQRIARITQEVLSGKRTLDDVRRSVDLLAGKAPYQPYGSQNADAQFLANPQLLAQRVRDIFVNRGVPIGTGAYT